MSKRDARLSKLLLIGHYRVTPSLYFKTRLSEKPDNDFDLLFMKMKLIFIGKVLQLSCV